MVPSESINVSSLGNRQTLVALRKAVYLDFDEYRQGLSLSECDRLANTGLLFCYPYLSENQFELAEHPISQRILMSVARKVGCHVDSQLASLGDERIEIFPETSRVPNYIIIHPMIAILDFLGELVADYRKRFPSAEVVLQNSDQNQHEKVIGGPRGAEIAQRLLDDIPGVDRVLLGFAEHALLALLLGKSTTAVIGRDGRGSARARLFMFSSLPDAETLIGSGVTTRSLRVQRARGCLAPCTFCIEGQANRSVDGERSWDGLPMPAFVDRLTKHVRQGHFFINITDSSFEDPGPRGLKDLHRFCELIIERGTQISIKIHLRAENALKASEDEMHLWKAAGIDVIVCGLESGSQAELDFYRKIATKEVSRKAFQHLEQTGAFCNILGYMMFSPIATEEILREKVEFLRDINRGWDFLNLTNRLLVFWGTVMHQQLIDEGLIDSSSRNIGYVPYRFLDERVRQLDHLFNNIKKERPGFMILNNLIYDAMNLESRMLNPANLKYRELAGEAFDAFRSNLEERKSRLSEHYCDGFIEVIESPGEPFLSGFDELAEYERQHQEIKACLQFEEHLPIPPKTIYLNTWLSEVNRRGISEKFVA